jgi:hypothetical protein
MTAGQALNELTRVGDAPDMVIRRVAVDVSGATGYSMTMVGAHTLVLARAIVPKWPLVAGGIGLVVFSFSLLTGFLTGLLIAAFLLLLGFLYFVLEKTESMTVRVSVDAGMTAVSVSGRATPDLVTRINGALGQSAAASSSPSPTRTGTSWRVQQ